MKCLILTPYVPYPLDAGGKVRIYHLLAGLASRHEIDVLALDLKGASGPADLRRLESLGLRAEKAIQVRGRLSAVGRAVARRSSVYNALHFSREYAAALRRKLNESRFDLVQCEFHYMAQYRDLFPPAQPWVLDAHNVEARVSETLARVAARRWDVLYHLYARRERAHKGREERSACRAAHHVLAVSEPDRRRLLDMVPEARVSVAPNGVDTASFRRPGDVPESLSPTGVFVGALRYRPNSDAVEWLCRDILPRIRREIPDFRLVVVGADAPRQIEDLATEDSAIQLTGRVPDVRPYLARATVVLVPLRAGSGTRLKILESLAMESAVVTTELGCEGIEVTDGEDLLIANTPSDFAGKAIEVCRNPELRHKLGSNGRCLVERRYDWAQAVDQVDQIWREVAARSDSARAV